MQYILTSAFPSLHASPLPPFSHCSSVYPTPKWKSKQTNKQTVRQTPAKKVHIHTNTKSLFCVDQLLLGWVLSLSITLHWRKHIFPLPVGINWADTHMDPETGTACTRPTQVQTRKTTFKKKWLLYNPSVSQPGRICVCSGDYVAIFRAMFHLYSVGEQVTTSSAIINTSQYMKEMWNQRIMWFRV